MNIIDIGANLLHRSFDADRETVIKEAEIAGVSPIIITGTSLRESREAADYVKNYPRKLYSTAGVHPHDAKTCNDRTIGELRKLAQRTEVIAIGECGLDYDRDFSPRDVQRKWFEAQLKLAEELKLPLFLHERAAHIDFKAILEAAGSSVCERAIVHCFTGTEQELDAYLSLGCYIGITGWICDERRGTHLRKIVSKIPKNKLMIETDAPFLFPRNMHSAIKTNRNSPEYLLHIAKDIAECRKEKVEDLAAYTFENTKRFFNITLS